MNSLKSLISHLQEMETYLENVVSGKLPPNRQIINNFQDIFNLLPNLNVGELSKSFSTKTNDMMLVIYLSSLIRSIIALHNLIDNKIENRDAEKKAEQEQQKKDKESKEPKENKEPKSSTDATTNNGTMNNNSTASDKKSKQ